MKILAAFLLAALICTAETKTLTLQQAVEIALKQNPDLVISRLEAQKAAEQVNIQKGPFSPSVYAGSGAAYTYGFPSSIDGNAPSIVQAKTNMAIYDKPQSYLVQQAKESARGAGFSMEQRQAEIIYRVASLFVDAQNAARTLDAAKQEEKILANVKQLTQARVEDGRDLPHETSKADLAQRQSAYKIATLDRDASSAERSLAVVLGLSPDRVHPAEEPAPALNLPVSQEEAIAAALDSSPELKRLDSDLKAKLLEVKSYQANRQPKVDLVAQYALLAPFNNYKEFFNRFQYNNFELGASFSIPVLANRAGRAYIASSSIDAQKIREQIKQTQARIRNDIENAFEDFHVAEEGRKLALADLDLTRESTSIDLARFGEGQVLQAQVEQDRAEEQQKWRAYYDALATAQRARLNLLRDTGTLQEALR